MLNLEKSAIDSPKEKVNFLTWTRMYFYSWIQLDFLDLTRTQHKTDELESLFYCDLPCDIADNLIVSFLCRQSMNIIVNCCQNLSMKVLCMIEVTFLQISSHSG